MSLLGNEYIDLNAPYIRELSLCSSSKGNQRKFYDGANHRYIKLAFNYGGTSYKDYLVEHLSWRLSTLCDTLGVDIVRQNVVNTSLGYGCASIDFLYGSDAEWISFYRLTGNHPSNSLYGKAYAMYEYIKDTYKQKTNLDITNYLIVMIVFDYLLLNEDRHFNNFGVIRCGDTFKVAPLFDFGLGLFEHDPKYNGVSLSHALSLSRSLPFCEDQWNAIEMLVNIGYGSVIRKVIDRLVIPHKGLFPSELSYEYVQFSLDNLKSLVR